MPRNFFFLCHRRVNWHIRALSSIVSIVLILPWSPNSHEQERKEISVFQFLVSDKCRNYIFVFIRSCAVQTATTFYTTMKHITMSLFLCILCLLSICLVCNKLSNWVNAFDLFARKLKKKVTKMHNITEWSIQCTLHITLCIAITHSVCARGMPFST